MIEGLTPIDKLFLLITIICFINIVMLFFTLIFYYKKSSEGEYNRRLKEIKKWQKKLQKKYKEL